MRTGLPQLGLSGGVRSPMPHACGRSEFAPSPRLSPRGLICHEVSSPQGRVLPPIVMGHASGRFSVTEDLPARCSVQPKNERAGRHQDNRLSGQEPSDSALYYRRLLTHYLYSSGAFDRVSTGQEFDMMCGAGGPPPHDGHSHRATTARR
jgi:hypothetical protein